MRTLVRVLLVALLACATLLVASPAHADAHSGETCSNWYPHSLYRMGVCVSVHHATGQATAHVRTHTYKRSCGTCGWVDMRADSQTINGWQVSTNAGYVVYLAASSVGGQITVTHHGAAWVTLQCYPSQPWAANAGVTSISMRADNGTPFGPAVFGVQSGYSQRPC